MAFVAVALIGLLSTYLFIITTPSTTSSKGFDMPTLTATPSTQPVPCSHSLCSDRAGLIHADAIVHDCLFTGAIWTSSEGVWRELSSTADRVQLSSFIPAE